MQPDLGSFTDKVTYDDPYTAHLLSYPEDERVLFTAISIMAAQAGKEEHQFEAHGNRYAVRRTEDGAFRISRL